MHGMLNYHFSALPHYTQPILRTPIWTSVRPLHRMGRTLSQSGPTLSWVWGLLLFRSPGPRTAPCPCPKGRVVCFSSCPRRHGSRLRQCVFPTDIASHTCTSAPWQALWSPALPPDFLMNTKWVSMRKNRQLLLLCGALRGPIMSHCPTLSFSIFFKLQLISSCLPTYWLSPLSTLLCIGGPVSTWKICFFLEFRPPVILQRQLSDGFKKST